MIDTHAHITSDELFEDIDHLLERAKRSHVIKIFNIATDESTLERGLEVKKRNTIVENIAATTPHDVDQEGESFFKVVEQAAKEGLLIAIGETGLDYYYAHSCIENQKIYFRKYIQLAIQVNLPLVIHCRDAFKDLIEILDEYPQMKKVVIHCFTGNMEEANWCIERGFMLSFSGILTYKKSIELQEVCAKVPLENLLIETDSPYLAPQTMRGKKNEPAYILETLQKMAFLKNKTVEQMTQITTENCKRLFHI